MRIRLFLLASILLCWNSSRAQFSRLTQYFDGADTSWTRSIIINMDTPAGNLWQIGKPSKVIFNSAATLPNALLTDTLNNYPAGNSSGFSFRFFDSSININRNALIAVRWKQKLDMERGRSGLVVEFSRAGKPWESIFNNPNVYRFYGYAFQNKDTLFNGQYAFSGSDTVWRDIWVCFTRQYPDSFETELRFTFVSDTGTSGKEGCMIDNMLVQTTFAHTIKAVGGERNSTVYPTHSSGTLYVEASRASQNEYVRTVQICAADGRMVRQYNGQDFRMILNINDLPTGQYLVKVATNSGNEVFPIELQR